MRAATFVGVLLVLMFCQGSVLAQGETQAQLLERAQLLSKQGETEKAAALATQAILMDPNVPTGWAVRAEIFAANREYNKAIASYEGYLVRDKKNPNIYQRRGELYFQSGRIAESITDFDQYLKMVPQQKPYHWQRGISLYYAGKFVEGKRQFELHQTVNSQDVENAVWHFLCTARAEGLEAARKKLIPIEQDARVPMAQVHRLFAGKATPQEVMAAAEAASQQTRYGEPRFYADLYLGLYYEAIGDEKKTKEHIFKAAERAKENGYMGDVARVHAELLKKKQAKTSAPKVNQP